MNGFLAIFLRELRATFFTSAGWMSLAIGSFLLAIVFMMLCFVPEGPATLQPVAAALRAALPAIDTFTASLLPASPQPIAMWASRALGGGYLKCHYLQAIT